MSVAVRFTTTNCTCWCFGTKEITKRLNWIEWGIAFLKFKQKNIFFSETRNKNTKQNKLNQTLTWVSSLVVSDWTMWHFVEMWCVASVKCDVLQPIKCSVWFGTRMKVWRVTLLGFAHNSTELSLSNIHATT